MSEIRKMRGGLVYLAESTRPDGSKQIYTGMTRRALWIRVREHIRGYGSKWTGRGTYFRLLGAVWSSNPRKAEQTIKRMSHARKRAFAHYAARAYYATRLVVATFIRLKRVIYRES